MSAIAPKGWCPSLFAPMPAGDGWLARIKPPRAILTTVAARALAQAATRFGNGAIALTNRANVQVRGLVPDGLAPFAKAMVGAGLADATPAVERRRAVIYPPLAGADPSASQDAVAMAAAIESSLSNDPRFRGLPAKFSVAVDGGGLLPLVGTNADIVVALQEETCLITPAGSEVAGRASPIHAHRAVLQLVLAFQEMAGEHAPPLRRIRMLVATIGAAGLLSAAGFGTIEPVPLRAIPKAVGWLPYPDSAYGAFGVGLPFGTVAASVLAKLADLAERFGNSELRLTPWRSLAIPGVEEPKAAALQAAAIALGLVVDSRDPRHAIVTCTGKPGCAAASVDVRSDALLLLPLNLSGPVHVSGCAKGCAHPAAAPITLVGEAGLYDIVRNGSARDAASACGLTMREAAALLGVEA
jgi:precorrin-3B synthase